VLLSKGRAIPSMKYSTFWEIESRQSLNSEVEMLDSIVMELGRRGIVVRLNRPTRWGYVVDAIIPSSKIVVLKTPYLSKPFEVAMITFQDMIKRLQGDGYRVLMVPRNTMNEEQIKAFCDRISVEPSPLAGQHS
jgi:hypothetical protein